MMDEMTPSPEFTTDDSTIVSAPPVEDGQTDPIDFKSLTQFVQNECITSFECPGDQVCAQQDSVGCDGLSATCESLPRKCVAARQVGESCDIAACAEGLTCKFEFSETNFTSTCVEKIGEDGKCETSNDACADGLRCADESTDVLFGGSEVPQFFACNKVKLGKAGDVCTQVLRDCEEGTFCDTSGLGPDGNATAMCKAKLSAGGICTGNDEECLNGFCAIDFYYSRTKGGLY